MNNKYEIGDKVILECEVKEIRQLADGGVFYKLKIGEYTELCQCYKYGGYDGYFQEDVFKSGEE